MKRTLILFCSLLLSSTFAFAQSEDVKKIKKIKIVTVDENGKETEIVKEIEGSDYEWTEEINNTHVIIKKSNGEEEVIVNSPANAHMKMHHEGAFLGVILGDVTDEGIKIDGVTEESAAEEAGLKKGDVITAIDGEKVLKSEGVVEIISSHKAGENVKINYKRDGKSKTTSATLTERDEDVVFMEKAIFIEVDGDKEVVFYGTPEDENKAFLGIKPADKVKGVTGVMILEAVEGSAAQEAGLQTGDIITKVDGNSISDFNGLVKALETKSPGDEIEVGYQRQGKNKTVKATLTSRKSAHKTIWIEEEIEND